MMRIELRPCSMDLCWPLANAEFQSYYSVYSFNSVLRLPSTSRTIVEVDCGRGPRARVSTLHAYVEGAVLPIGKCGVGTSCQSSV